MQLFGYFVTCFAIISLGNAADDVIDESYKILRKIFENYDDRIPPVTQKGKAVVNYIQLYILSIDSISDFNMDFTMNFYLRQSWRDPRLAFTSDNLTLLELDTSSLDKIWTPDTYFINDKSSELHDVTYPNKLFHIFHDGTVLYSMRISGKFSSNMELHKFPLDKQAFRIELASFGYGDQTLQFRWMPNAVVLSPDLNMAQFVLRNSSVYDCDAKYLRHVNFSCIGLQLDLDRRFGYYIVQIYIPSIMIILISWISMWLSVEAVPARCSLGILTVIAMTSQYSGMITFTARVTYVKALDVWMVVCLGFVFSAIVEFAIVDLTSRTGMKSLPLCSEASEGYKCPATDDPDKAHENQKDTEEEEKQRKIEEKQRRHHKAVKIDRIARVLFPLSFILFNIIYWSVYASS